MKTVSMLYDNPCILDQKIEARLLSPDKAYLVMIYTANATPEDAVGIAREIQERLPLAQIIGSSASGVIYKGSQYPDSNLAVISEFETSHFATASFSWKDKTARAVTEEIKNTLKDGQIRLMHVLCADHYYDSHDFAGCFNQIFPGTKLVGGIAGDVLPLNIPAYVFTPDGIVENGIVAAALFGSSLQTYNGVSISHEPISPKYKLTDNRGSFWKMVNDQPADSWFREHLGIEDLTNYADWQVIADNDVMIRFPVILEDHHGASRFIKYDMDEKCISQYFSQIPPGSEFRIGYVSPAECVKDSFQLCNEVMAHPIESLFCYSCLFRRLYLHNCADWELKPYHDLDMSGAFVMGEFSNIDGTNEFLNGSCCIVGTAEHQIYVRPDIDAFEELGLIEDDKKNLLNFVLKRQSESINKYNEVLLEQLLEQNHKAEEQIYIDYSTGANNYIKYKEDRKTHHFNKLGMVKIENYDLLVTSRGHDAYIKIIQKALKEVLAFVSTITEADAMHFYTFNENTFFVASADQISESHFIEVLKAMFNQFNVFKPQGQEDVLVSRIVITSDQANLIESALNTFEASKNIQNPFIICEKETTQNLTSEQEFQIIGVLNRAIENNGIVPYFQGIYDNTLKKIGKYEALMRIVDEDGTVYLPAQFMGIAKKYHLYSILSQRMLTQVAGLFKNKKVCTGINISVYDINSPEIQEFIFQLLDTIGDASNFILEILEDEEFRDVEMLIHFIVRARKYGAKIAIDDFGSGYSNLLEIASIQPDYIKVDGGIIRKIHSDEVNRKILDIIVYMGRLLGTDIVAEYVENQEIQEIIEQKNIRFSQGFYFSLPQPYEMIKDQIY